MFKFEIKNTLFFLCLSLGLSFAAKAQTYSYVYIQGDKNHPFYVQYEGKTVARYGNNYSIISKLLEGPITISIQFQESTLSDLEFNIKVPKAGERSFLLTQDHGEFALYDLQNKFYLYNKNNIEEDKTEQKITVANADDRGHKNKDIAEVEKKPRPKKSENYTAKNQQKDSDPIAKRQTELHSDEPQFIENIVLPNKQKPQSLNAEPADNTPVFTPEETEGDNESSANETKKQKAPKIKKTKKEKIVKEREEKPKSEKSVAVLNSDCPEPITEEEFEMIYYPLLEQNSDEDILKIMRRNYKNCYTTNMVEKMASTLKTDAGKYSLIKKLYPRVTDQSHYADLEKLFENAAYKNSFSELINPQ